MRFHSIEPFIPSGSNFEKSRQLFLEIGFEIRWEGNGYVGFQKDNCQFILQNYDDRHFAENLMIRITVSNLDEFWQEMGKKQLAKKFDIKVKEPTVFPHGREINLIDLAGVCWHIAEAE
jgi:hypothetical protein